MKKTILFVCACFLSGISIFSGCTNQPKETGQVSIVSFDVEPGTINQGESATLSWVVSGATSVSIDHDIGNVTLSGHQIIFPTQDTTYILTASNSNTSHQATITIYVSGTLGEGTQPTPSVSMTATPIAGTGICSVTIAAIASPTIAWATDVIAKLNCITNATKMAALDITMPTTGMMAGGDVISCTSLTAGNLYTLTLTYKATGGTMGTVTWVQI